MRALVTIDAFRLPCVHAAPDNSTSSAMTFSANSFVGYGYFMGCPMAISADQLIMNACTKRSSGFMTLQADLVSNKLA